MRFIKCFTVSLLSLSLALITPAPSQAQIISVGEAANIKSSLSDRLLLELEKEENIKKLDELGVSKEEARLRIAGLSDEEIKGLISQSGNQAGGEAVVIGLTTILLIVIIVLLID